MVASNSNIQNIETINKLSKILKNNYSNYEIICVTEDARVVASKDTKKY